MEYGTSTIHVGVIAVNPSNSGNYFDQNVEPINAMLSFIPSHQSESFLSLMVNAILDELGV